MVAPPRPHWITLRDLLFPGSLVPLSFAATLWVCFADIDSATPGQTLPTGVFGAQGLMGFVTLVLAGVYGRLLWLRYQALKPFIFIQGPFYSIMLDPGRYRGSLEPHLVIGQFHTAFDVWQKAFPWSQIRDFADNALFWVWLRPLPIECNWGSREAVNGYTIVRSRKMVIGYKHAKEPLAETALQHEIGHILQGELTGSWMMSEHHDKAKALGIR